MPALKDLTGKRFGKLTILRRSERKQRGTTLWVALCDCGKETIAAANNIKTGTTKSCGCLKHKPSYNSVDRTGVRFEMLTVIRRVDEKSNDRKNRWLCHCDCGNEKVVSGTNLRPGGVKSCGCLRRTAPGRRISEVENPVTRKSGYVCIRGIDRNGKTKERPQHVVVMERTIGRKLFPGETVHHKNGIRSDNRIQNLELWSKNHAPGQRVTDMIDFCLEYLSEYAPECLAITKDSKCGSGI